MLIVLLLLCLYLCGGDGFIMEGSCAERERKALLAIKADIYDPDQWLSSWRAKTIVDGREWAATISWAMW